MLNLGDCYDIGINTMKLRLLKRFNFVPPPRVIAYTVTWRCNAGCDMCGIKTVDRDLKNIGREMSAEDISQIFSDPLLKKLDLIRFTGGEPFLKEDFALIVEEIVKNTRTKLYYVTTNGFFTQEVLDFVKRLALLDTRKTQQRLTGRAPRSANLVNLVIQVSLDAIGKAHDNIRKLPGLYDKAIETLEGLRGLKRSYNFSFGINQTVTPDTLGYIEEISALSLKLKCDHKIYVAYEGHESKILEGERLGHELRLISNPKKDEAKELYDRIEKFYQKKKRKNRPLVSAKNLWDIVERNVLLGGKNRVLEGRAFPNPACLAMFFYLRLLPDGTIMPCTLKPKPIGNLKDESFTKIWNSKLAQEMRSEVRSCRGCWIECDIVPNIVYSFDTVKKMLKGC